MLFKHIKLLGFISRLSFSAGVEQLIYRTLSLNTSQSVHDVKATLYGRHFNVLTSYQRPYNVVITLCTGGLWYSKLPLSGTLKFLPKLTEGFLLFKWKEAVADPKVRKVRNCEPSKREEKNICDIARASFPLCNTLNPPSTS